MATIIDPDKAKSLIQEYRDQNAADGGTGLVTPDNSPHNGFFIDRASIESVLKNPNVAGVHLDFAKHPDFTGTPGKVLTMVMSGAEPDTDPAATTQYKATGPLYSDMPPCPPTCTNMA